MVKLTLYILGLCGLIQFPGAGGRPVIDAVFLGGQASGDMPAHTLQFRMNVGTINRSSIPTANGREDEFLTGYAVTIHCSNTARPASPPSTLEIASDERGLPWRSLSWVMDMAKLAPGARVKPLPGDVRIGASIRLLAGRIEAAAPSNSVLENVLWKVGDASQALTNRVQYTLECPTRDVELRMYPLSGGDLKIVRLSPAPGSSDIVATIRNLPPPVLTKASDVTIGRPATHVAAAYDLLASPPASRQVPTIQSRPRPIDPVATDTDPIWCFLVHIPHPGDPWPDDPYHLKDPIRIGGPDDRAAPGVLR
jgi:hypothetical protein